MGRGGLKHISVVIYKKIYTLYRGLRKSLGGGLSPRNTLLRFNTIRHGFTRDLQHKHRNNQLWILLFHSHLRFINR